MGNHHASKAMGIAAEAAFRANRKHLNKETALKILDTICKPWKGCDAEFESEDPKKPGHIHPDYTFYTDPMAPLGKLIAVAFGKKGVDYVDEFKKDNDEKGSWYDGPYTAFHKRYDFC